MNNLFKVGQNIRVKSFLGTLKDENVDQGEDYWKLIGYHGKILKIDKDNIPIKYLILFDENFSKLHLICHNPIDNSLWMNETDIELI